MAVSPTFYNDMMSTTPGQVIMLMMLMMIMMILVLMIVMVEISGQVI